MTGRILAGLVAGVMVLSACGGGGQPDSRPDGQPDGAGEPAATATTRTPTTTPQTRRTEASVRPSQEELDRRLIAAAWDDAVGRARRLIRAGADVNAKDDTVQSAYLIATSEGHLDLLELALRNGANVRARDSFDGTGLIRAADRGHHLVAGRLVRAGVEVDHVNNLGWTALHEAIILGDGGTRYADTVRVLVAAGADVELPSQRDGVAPLAHAESKGYDAIAGTLRRAIDRAPYRDPDGVLLRAASQGDADLVALALRDGADLGARDRDGRTALLLAATYDNLAAARLLVALGADPDALDGQHDTPWLVTGVTGSVQMLETLLPARPDLAIRNRFGGTSLIPASERGHVDYVRRVVQTGIDVNHVNDLGWTALLEAVVLGDGSAPYQRIVRILLAAGADPGIGDKEGATALEHARASGQERVAAILEGAVR